MENTFLLSVFECGGLVDKLEIGEHRECQNYCGIDFCSG